MNMYTMDEAIRGYIDEIAPGHRPLFDRLHKLIMTEHPDAEVVLSYGIPTFKVGDHRLHGGAWKHGLSIYGWGRAASTPSSSDTRRSDAQVQSGNHCDPQIPMSSPTTNSV
jgi:hypothetical protein